MDAAWRAPRPLRNFPGDRTTSAGPVRCRHGWRTSCLPERLLLFAKLLGIREMSNAIHLGKPWRTHSCVMPQAFPITDHLHKLWGGPPGPRPAPWPASPRSCKSLYGMSHERVQGDPRGPGGPPHNLCRIHVSRKACGITHECVRYEARYTVFC